MDWLLVAAASLAIQVPLVATPPAGRAWLFAAVVPAFAALGLRRRPAKLLALALMSVASAAAAMTTVRGADPARWTAGPQAVVGPSSRPLLEGRIVHVAPASDGVGRRWIVAIDHIDGLRVASGRVSVGLRRVERRWWVGDRVRFRSALRAPRNFGNPGEMDWRSWNLRRGIALGAWVWSDEEVELRMRGEGLLARWRRHATLAALEAGPGGGLLAALLTGDRRFLAPADGQAMRDSGLAHMLALSGLHVGLVVAAAALFVRALLAMAGLAPRRDPEVPAAAVAAAAAALYAAGSGGAVSALRAAVAAAFMLAARAGLGRGSPPAWTAMAAIALAWSMPGVVLEPSFVLSFSAALALVLWMPRALSAGTRGVPGLVAASIEVSLVCWLVTAPLLMQYFGRLALWAPLANLPAAPPLVAAVTLGLGAAVVTPLWPEGGARVMEVAALSASVLVAWAHRVAELPGAGLPTPAPGWPLTACWLAALAALASDGRGRRWLGPLVVIAVALAAAGAGARFRGDRLEAVMLSVGQGDATFLQLPGGATVLVDAGRPGRGRLVVAPWLRRRWVARLDLVIVTHLDDDHAGGVPEVLEEVGVERLWLPAGHCEGALAERILALAARRGAVVEWVGASRPLPSVVHGGATIEALWPLDEVGDCGANDRSVVVRARFAGRALLLPGDIEVAAESALVAAAAPRLAADVLKAPHHGSRSSSTPSFLEAVAPRDVLVSVGAANRYGLPAPEVLERYRQLGLNVWRSDRHGAITVLLEEGGPGVTAARTGAASTGR